MTSLMFQINDCSLLGKALATFRWMRDVANVNFSSSGVSIIASHPLDSFIAVLKINPSGCGNFHCPESGTIGVDLRYLRYRMKGFITDPCSLWFYIFANGDIAFFFIVQLFMMPKLWCIPMKSSGVDDRLLPTNPVPGAYAATVSIPSEKFRRIFRYATSRRTVHISVRSHQVTIRSVVPRGMEIVLTTENEECTIEGATGEEPLNFVVTLDFVRSFIEASNITDTVLLHLDDTKPLLLNFPLGSLGSFMFYVVRSHN